MLFLPFIIYNQTSKMNNAIIRSITSTFFSSPSKIHQTNFNLNWNSSVVTFRKFTTVSSKPDNKHDMDKTQNPDQNNKSNENVMSHSFGEGYATRSDEEGFGGIYGGNQQLPKVDIDKKIHEGHPAYDKTQGSEVKEKEKGRHQSNSDS